MSYAELQVTTHFSFLRGASSAEELFAQAAMLGIPALGIVDRNSLAGVVRAHEAAKVTGVRLVVGCRLDLEDGTAMLVYPTDRAAYSRLCRLLSIGKGRAGKGACRLTWEDVAKWGEGLIAVLVPDGVDVLLRKSAPPLGADIIRWRLVTRPIRGSACAKGARGWARTMEVVTVAGRRGVSCRAGP